MWDRNQMAERAAQELQDGWYVNLGHRYPDACIQLHSRRNRSYPAI